MIRAGFKSVIRAEILAYPISLRSVIAALRGRVLYSFAVLVLASPSIWYLLFIQSLDITFQVEEQPLALS